MTTESEENESRIDQEETTSLSPGELLQGERERQGYSEKQVADQLHITMHYVRAIETDTYEKLPGIIFARGYIKSYAVLLGMDTDFIVSLFNERVGEQSRTPQVRSAELESSGRGGKHWWFPWVAVAIAAFLCGFLVFWAYTSFIEPGLEEQTETGANILPNGNLAGQGVDQVSSQVNNQPAAQDRHTTSIDNDKGNQGSTSLSVALQVAL